MPAIILIDLQNPKFTDVFCDDYGKNIVFDSVESADMYRSDNADDFPGATRIIDLDD